MKPLNARYPTRRAWEKALVLSCGLLIMAAGQADEATPGPSLLGDKTQFNLGLGAAVVPRYMGSDEYRGQLVPLLNIQRGIFFLDSVHGLGVQWQSPSGFSASAGLAYDFGRSEKNSTGRPGSTELRGMGTVGGATVADINLAQQLLPWLSVTGEAELRMAGERRGNRYRLGLEAIAVHSDSDALTVDLDAHAGDGRYNQTYFGVDAQQSQRTAFSRFTADSGVYAYSATLNWQHTFDAHWSSVASLGLTHYTDQVRGSPVLQTDAQSTALLALNYSF